MGGCSGTPLGDVTLAEVGKREGERKSCYTISWRKKKGKKKKTGAQTVGGEH